MANNEGHAQTVEESLTVTPRVGHIAVSVDNFMLVWGGYKEDRVSHSEKYLPGNIVNIYHSDSKYWTIHKTTGQAPPGTSGPGSYIIQGKLFIFGGFTAAGNSNGLYILDLKSLDWTCWKEHCDTIDDPRDAIALPSPRDKFSFWTYNDKLYCFGGFGPPLTGFMQDHGHFVPDTSSPWETGRGWNNQVVVFDPVTEQWTNPVCKGPVPSPRAAHGSERVGNKVYTFGGRHKDSRLDDLHLLDLDTYTWSGELYVEGASPCGRSWHSFTKVSDDVIFLYGGYSNARMPLSDAWQLNVTCLQWSQITVQNDRPRLWHTCVCTGDKELLVFGGCCSNILDLNESIVFSARHVSVMPVNCIQWWQITVQNDRPRLWHTCVCTGDKEILVFGGCCSNIIDLNESIVQSNEVLSFLIQPLKLQRLCLEAVFYYRNINKCDWIMLPAVLKDWLFKRENVELKANLNSEQKAKDKNTIGSTCCLS